MGATPEKIYTAASACNLSCTNLYTVDETPGFRVLTTTTSMGALIVIHFSIHLLFRIEFYELLAYGHGLAGL